ncbi:MAG: hypothetical protein F4Y08_07675 [Caldilineaceae bacterium SB0662_bin_9]|uniref:Uncharacterized protein n=1 Tax=Caldilineaceae bacterium SB0662_bin_9 TaxID=2605258 RepID=A0A6B1DV14_9CHLR|nr:hypothetical protein [Caldilineaceae bacterium SB0662_bin_9]
MSVNSIRECTSPDPWSTTNGLGRRLVAGGPTHSVPLPTPRAAAGRASGCSADRKSRSGSQRRQGDPVTSEAHNRIASKSAEARALLQIVHSRQDRGNSLPRVLDMPFREDESRIRTGHAAHNVSIPRRLEQRVPAQESELPTRTV